MRLSSIAAVSTLAVAGAAAAFLLSTVVDVTAAGTAVAAKKSKAEELAELKEKVKEKYVTKGGGLLFNHYRYWVDLESVGDSRWTQAGFKGGKPSESQYLVFSAKWTPSIDATPDQGMTLVIWRYLATTPGYKHSTTFKNTGESVSNADGDALCEASCRNYIAGAKDVEKKETVEGKKKKLGEFGYYAAAQAKDAESGERQRKEWFMFSDGKEGSVYVCTVTFGAALLGKKGKNTRSKAYDFLKKIKPVKEFK